MILGEAITLLVIFLFVGVGAYSSAKLLGSDIKITVHLMLSSIIIFSVWGAATIGIKLDSPIAWLATFVIGVGVFIIYIKRVSSGLTIKQVLLIYFGILFRMFAVLVVFGIGIKAIMLLIHALNISDL